MCRGRCTRFGRNDGDDDDEDNDVVDDDSYGDAYGWVPIIAAVQQTEVAGWRNEPITRSSSTRGEYFIIHDIY